MKEKTEFQKFVIKQLHLLLSDQDFKKNYKNPGYKEMINTIVRHYPEITEDGKTTWTDIEMYKKCFKISKRAMKKIEESNLSSKEIWKEVHFEHIFPIALTINCLIMLEKPSIIQIEKIMELSEIIILSKEEAAVLDGSPSKLYMLDNELIQGKGMRSSGYPEERLKAINCKIHESTIDNSLFNKDLKRTN